MSRRHLGWILAIECLILCGSGGCSRVPSGPEQPEINPREAGKAAIAEYDTNADGKLDSAEIDKCPSLKHALENAKKPVDSNGDGALTAKEITARINYWLDCDVTIIDGTTWITLDGRPLKGATVTFEPEKFLGPAFTPCQGVTTEHGDATLQGPDATFPGIYLGLYRVKVSKVVNGRETIPPKYNSNTVLGFEASDDHEGVGTIEFSLQSK